MKIDDFIKLLESAKAEGATNVDFAAPIKNDPDNGEIIGNLTGYYDFYDDSTATFDLYFGGVNNEEN